MPENTNKDKLSNYSIDFDFGDWMELEVAADPLPIFTPQDKKFSISVWMKTADATPSANSYLFSTMSAGGATKMGLYLDTSGNVNWKVYSGSPQKGITSTATLSDNTWYHIVGTWDGSTINLYIDGTSAATPVAATDAYTPTTGNSFATLGAYRYQTSGTQKGGYYTGDLAQVSVWNSVALSESQIQYLYNLNNPMVPGNVNLPTPIAYYPLGDNSNPTATAGYPNISVEADSVFQFPGGTTYPNTITFGTGTTEELQITDKITASIWIKTTDTAYSGQPAEAFLSRNMYSEGWWLAKRYENATDRRLRLVLYNTNGASNTLDVNNWDTLIADGKWHHIAFTYDGTSNAGGLKIYIDGEFKEEMATSSTGIKDTIGSAWETLQLGQRQYLYETLDGEYSNLSIFNTDLPATGTQSIESLYANGVPPEISNYNNLVGWWKLNQSASWEADSVGDWQVPDNRSAYPQSFDFDGSSSSYIDTNIDLSSVTDITISLWAKWDDFNNYQYAFMAGKKTAGNSAISISKWTNTGEIYSWDGTTSHKTGTSVVLNTWNHIVVTQAGTERKVYLNGNLIGTFTAAALNLSNNNVIGRYYNASAATAFYYMKGKLSNVQLWDSALPETGTDSVETLYNNGTPLTNAIATDNLKGWWKLNDNEKFDGTNWSVENQKYPANYESALNFDATAALITIPDSSALRLVGTDFSISFWLHPKASGNQIIMDKYGPAAAGWGVYLQSGNLRFISFLPNNWQTMTTIDQGVWTHVLIVGDNTGQNLICYKNGTEVYNAAYALGVISNTTDLIVGTEDSSGSLDYVGDLSNLVIWNSNQSSEKDNIYNSGTPANSYTNTPVGWWKLNNVTTGIQDLAGSSNGVITGNVTKVNTFVSTEAATSSGMTEQNLVNNNVSALNGESGGLNTTNLVQSNLTRKQPYSNYSFNFDQGASDYFNCSNVSVLKNASVITWNLWVNFHTQAFNVIFGKALNTTDVIQFYTWSAGKGYFWLKTAGSPVTAVIDPLVPGTVPLNEWAMFTIVFDGSQSGNDRLKIYLNGGATNIITSYQNTTPATLPNTTDDFFIGRGYNGYFDGKISNFAIWDSVLTNDDRINLYNNGVPQDLNNFRIEPVNWWPLDGSSSYYNGTDWVTRDVKSGQDGDGNNTGNVDDLVGNAPGSEVNGVGSNLTIADLKANMKSSDKNAYSINMGDYADGVTNPANSGRSTNVP